MFGWSGKEGLASELIQETSEGSGSVSVWPRVSRRVPCLLLSCLCASHIKFHVPLATVLVLGYNDSNVPQGHGV